MNRLVKKSNKIQDLLVISSDIYYDFRGENCELFNKKDYKKILDDNNIHEIDFVVDSFSFSKKDVLRGFHGDTKTWKLIECLQGEIYFVVLDLRNKSKTYGNHEIFHLNDKNRLQVLVPAGCVNAHLCISNTCIFHYKLSELYTKQEDQMNVKWNDPRHEIYWPISNPILSERDSHD